MNTRRIPVSGGFIGLVFLIVGALCFVDIYYSYFTSEAPIESKIVMGVSVLIMLFGIGYFIPSIRDSGFRYYIPVQKKRKETVEKAKEKGIVLKYPGKWQNFLFQTFRKGSVAEECSDSWRKLKQGESSYSFLEDCKNIQEAVDKHRDMATKIAIQFPKLGVSKMYHDSEKYQCLDTGFLLFSVLAVLLVAVNIPLNYLKNYDFPITQPPFFGVLFFALHKLCKQKSKDMAHRYLYTINSIWKREEERKRKAEEERKKKLPQINIIKSPNTTIKVGDITVENSKGVQIGDNNTSSNNINL